MAVENLTTWTLVNPDTVLTVTSTTLTAAGMNATFAVPMDQISLDKGSGFYSGNFTFRTGPVNISSASSNNSRITILGAGLAQIDGNNGLQGSMAAVWVNTATNPTLSLVEFNSTNTGLVPDSATTIANYQNAAVAIGTNFWLELSRTGTTATLKVYSDAYTTILTTLSFTLTQTLSYEFVFIGKAPASSGATISATVQSVDLAPSGGAFSLVAASGSFALTGQAATLTQNNSALLIAATGVFVYSGATSNSLFTVPAVFGSFTMAGQNANLTGPVAPGTGKGSLLLLGVGN